MKKIKFINLPSDFEIENLRSVLTEAICDKDFDFVVSSTKKCIVMDGITWDEILEKAVPPNYLCGVSLGSPAGIALTYPPKFPMIDCGMVAFASERIRSSVGFGHFKNFPYFLHFRKWSSIEFEMYYFIDFLLESKSIFIYEYEKNVINEYGASSEFGLNKLLFYPNLGLICYSADLPNIEKVALSIKKRTSKFLRHNYFIFCLSRLKSLILKSKKNNDFNKNYNI